MNIARKPSAWQPPDSIARDEIVARSAAILAKPDTIKKLTEAGFEVLTLGASVGIPAAAAAS